MAPTTLVRKNGHPHNWNCTNYWNLLDRYLQDANWHILGALVDKDEFVTIFPGNSINPGLIDYACYGLVGLLCRTSDTTGATQRWDVLSIERLTPHRSTPLFFSVRMKIMNKPAKCRGLEVGIYQLDSGPVGVGQVSM